MTEEKKPKRMKLTILEVKPRQVINAERGTTKLTFKAHNEDGEHWFYTFRNSLFETIEGGKDKTLEADVITTESEQWGTQRDVKQLYVDGQPLGSKGRSGSWGGKSPQEIASIENQVRAKLIVELRIAGVFDDNHPTYKKCLLWLDKLEVAEKAKAITTVPKQESSQVKVFDLTGVEEPFEEAKQEGTVPKTTEELLTWIMEKMNWKSSTPAKSFIVNKCKIPEEKIESDPLGVYYEVKALQGW